MRVAVRSLSYSDTPLLDARVLLKFVTGVDDAGLIAAAKDPLPARMREAYEALVARRANGEPVAYLTGVKEFWSLEFGVAPGVLIPREDSECLIDFASKAFSADAQLSILDLGTGSGCLLCALLKEASIAQKKQSRRRHKMRRN